MEHPILTFAARDEWYGVRARDVREVAELRAVRPVPRAPHLVAGLAEVHGRVVTLIDLDRLARETGGDESADEPVPGEAAVAPAGGPWYGVVLAAPFDHLGLLVRSRLDVASAAPALEEPAAGGGVVMTRLTVGERLLNLIALPALVERVETAVRRGFRPGGGARRAAED